MVLKTYTLGNNGFVSSDVEDALGLPRHRSQANVLIAAATKKAAVELAEQTPHIRTPSLGDSEFRQATGWRIDALTAAGLCDQPGIFVAPHLGRAADLVAMVDGDRVKLVGRFVGEFRNGTFEPVEG